MFAEFKHTLRRMRGQIIGWGVGLFLYGLMMISFYSSVKEMGDQFMDLMDSYPPEMLAFFPSVYEFTSPIGYMDTYFFSYMTFIIGIFVTSAGGRLLVGDEESGVLDLVMAYPVSRTRLFWGRLLGLLTATALVLLISLLGWLIRLDGSGLDLTAFELLLPFIPLFAVLALFGTLALLLSMFLPAARLAGGLSGALLVANFLLIGLSSLNEDLKPIFEKTPLYFYQGGGAIEGLNWEWLGGLLGVTLLLILLAWWRFEHRDIRVGGEGGWNIPLISKMRVRKVER